MQHRSGVVVCQPAQPVDLLGTPHCHRQGIWQSRIHRIVASVGAHNRQVARSTQSAGCLCCRLGRKQRQITVGRVSFDQGQRTDPRMCIVGADHPFDSKQWIGPVIVSAQKHCARVGIAQMEFDDFGAVGQQPLVEGMADPDRRGARHGSRGGVQPC